MPDLLDSLSIPGSPLAKAIRLYVIAFLYGGSSTWKVFVALRSLNDYEMQALKPLIAQCAITSGM